MALSKRNSRSITVADVEYRWTVSARSQAQSDMVTVVVQPPDDGCRLAVEIPCRDPYLKIQEPKPEVDVRDVTPKLIRQLILDGQSIGWQSNQSGGQFTIPCVIADLCDEGGEHGATCHVCWQCPQCNEWYSDDVQFGEAPPLITACGRTKHHADQAQFNVILFW